MGIGTRLAARLDGATVNAQVLRAAGWVTVVGVLVKLLAMGKEIAVAGVYGRSDAMDAFLAASLLPGLLINLIAESMNQALVPTLIRVRERDGPGGAQELLSSSMLAMCLLLGTVSLLMAGAARALFPLIALNFSAAKLNLSIHMFYALLPVVLITGIGTNCTAVLNTLDRFAVPALTALLTPLAILAAALTLGARLGIWALVWATLFGAIAQAGAVAAMMQLAGYRLRLRWHGMTQATREVAGQYGPVLLSAAAASGGLLVDQSMAAMLPSGSVSALVYGGRFVSVVLALLAGALATAITPYFSRLAAQGDWAGCRGAIHSWARLTALVSAPVALLLIAGAHAVVRVALQHGVFGPRDTAVVARVLAMYAIQIPFYVSSRVYYRFLIAMRRTDLALYCGILNLILDVVLNLALMRWMGVAGIALATSLWTVSTFLLLRHWAWKVLDRAQMQSLLPAD